jgi:hypothetical protein
MGNGEINDSLSINAWTGAGHATGALDAGAGRWAVKKQLPDYPSKLVAGEPADPRDWRNKDVGWGVVLPDNDALSVANRANAVDAPESIKTLLAARAGPPVFRYRTDAPAGFLRRYLADGRVFDIALSGSDSGIGEDKLPMYMLIVASPQEIPWRFQYLMNATCFTGRLDLDEPARARYVAALINDWKDSASSSNRPVVWTVDHGQPDITWLMRQTIADPVAQKMQEDSDIGDGVTHLAGVGATGPALIDALAKAKPALVVTTSHGLTSPLDDLPTMRKQLGFLVDHTGASVTADALLDKWQPDGAVWYAHACCSAGSDAATSYKGLIQAESSIALTLDSVAALGAMVAPLPKALLSAAKPARAFIGHVEPTFNMTLRSLENRQVLTASIRRALYDRMFRKQPEPIGMAIAGCYRHVGELFTQWQQQVQDVNRGVRKAREAAMHSQLMAIDRQSMVILGDPTVAIPALTTSGS